MRRVVLSATAVTLSALVAASMLLPTTASAAVQVNPRNVGTGVPVATAADPAGGFWVADTDGAVTAEAGARNFGGAQGLALGSPVIDIAAVASGGGYWEVTAKGNVYEFGSARFHGSLAGHTLKQPVIGIASSANGKGYWVAQKNGVVHAYGDAPGYGSVNPKVLRGAIVAIVSRPGGYWLFGSDGSVYPFGYLRGYGSQRGQHMTTPIVAAGATPNGRGYWLIHRNGTIRMFGAAANHGGPNPAVHALPAPVVAFSPTPTATGAGYWVLLGNGQVLRYGNAKAAARVSSAGYSLAGQVVGIDPGHNGRNRDDPSYINRPVWNGREYESCDTTGTETDSSYTEAAYNFDVATRLAKILRSRGATVVMTRTSNNGIGPCITTRAQIINNAKSDVSVDIHADGGPAGGRGVAVLEPVADGPNNKVIASSRTFAADLLTEFRAHTQEPDSSYDGRNGLTPRNDLAGLNLTTVPKVLIETANMRNSTDARLVQSPSWRQEAAQGMSRGITRFLTGY